MSTSMNCETCKLHLYDVVDGKLDSAEQIAVNEHLESCEACNETLAELWNLQAMATRWQDRPVPGWNRRGFFFEGSNLGWLPMLQVGSVFASVLVLVMMLTQVQISTADGFTMRFGEDLALKEDLAREVAELRDEQQLLLDERVSRLTTQQVASNQLVLNTLLQVSREERREDLSTLVTLWDERQDLQSQRTQAGLRVLLDNQLKDRRNIQQLGQALQLVANEGGTL